MKTLNIEVEGMKCNGCVNKVLNHFKTVEDVQETKVSLEDKKVTLICENSVSNMQVRNDIIELGFEVRGIQKA